MNKKAIAAIIAAIIAVLTAIYSFIDEDPTTNPDVSGTIEAVGDAVEAVRSNDSE